MQISNQNSPDEQDDFATGASTGGSENYENDTEDQSDYPGTETGDATDDMDSEDIDSDDDLDLDDDDDLDIDEDDDLVDDEDESANDVDGNGGYSDTANSSI